MARKLTITRKGYRRKGFTLIRGGKRVHIPPAIVSGSRFQVLDRGAKGRGPKVVPPLDKGSLGGPGFFHKPTTERRALLKRLARTQGEKKVVGKLRAIQVFNKRTHPELAKKALADSKFIASSFEGKNPARSRRAK